MINENPDWENLEDIIIFPEQEVKKKHINFLKTHYEYARKYIKEKNLKELQTTIDSLKEHYDNNRDYLLEDSNKDLENEYIIKLDILYRAYHNLEKKLYS